MRVSNNKKTRYVGSQASFGSKTSTEPTLCNPKEQLKEMWGGRPRIPGADLIRQKEREAEVKQSRGTVRPA